VPIDPSGLFAVNAFGDLRPADFPTGQGYKFPDLGPDMQRRKFSIT
jgi:hypothetical protein